MERRDGSFFRLRLMGAGRALLLGLVAGFSISTASASGGTETRLPINPATGEPYVFSRAAAEEQKLALSELICHTALGAPHNFAFGASLTAPTLLEENAFSVTAWTLNLALKACPPALDAPQDIVIEPPAGVCEGKISRP
ncbi:MAG: hypothetical protein AAGA23_23665, partial [Pseudomonadota bacterium]